ncbi:putative Xre family DNA binding protein [Microlunatus phosphovorus NM-1]|uniref:Putative Xre family DNA binding protein n=1 Tax=Microlunatus phosphovorus (strain ATCC 700054 / DSM 10555 / JCM 9379 / NBRC 101784 / NCIMB 13414 / VKM Ac-1990 / NM-1) TaxID=1032480 RepID=F5XIQ6_MICPN|nr:helix-turn-helix transcriptional regulator [Microlunatus phosphovorus]BAK38294.1 putative Xre family DNA binding protein [Microlunatus phosphovorus NM-1]
MTRESPLDSGVSAAGVDDLVRLGQRIAAVRKQRGWTQSDLSEAAGISRVTVSKIERGTTDVGYVRLVRLARALEVSTSVFVD